MTLYVVRIIEPDGQRRYLGHGRVVPRIDIATFYSSPSAANHARAGYIVRHADRMFQIDVLAGKAAAEESRP